MLMDFNGKAMRLGITFLASLLLTACFSPGQKAEPNAGEAGSTREALIEAYRQQRRLLYVYGAGDTAAAAGYASLLAQVQLQGNRTKVLVRSDREVTDAELHEWPLFLLGTPMSNAVLRRLLPRLPLNATSHTIEFNQQQYGDHPVLCIGFYPNPLAPDLPLSLMTGVADQDVLEHVYTHHQGHYYGLGSGWGYELYDGGRRKVMGFFDASNPRQWAIGGKAHWDFTYDGQFLRKQGHFTFYGHQGEFPARVTDSVALSLELQHQRISAQLGREMPQPVVDVHLYPSIEIKGLVMGNTGPASRGEDGKSLHLVLHPAWAGHDSPEYGLLLLGHAQLSLASAALQLGIAMSATEQWGRLGWRSWAGKFAHAGNALSLAELLDPDTWAHESPYLKACMAAALVEFMMAEFGKERFLAWCQASDPKALQELRVHEVAWENYLASLPVPPPDQFHRPLPSFHKAFNFAHEGYHIFNGYASKEATASMDYLAAHMHCNAVAIIPYAGYADVHAPAWLEIADGAGAENDESIVHALWSARRAGMEVILKPQVWPWNSWTGEVEMASETDWNTFFDHYYRWIRHYAILAEMYGAGILCIGVEFSKAALKRPDDWRKMVTRLRPLYHGKITYAANWGEEFEQCQFWDALDFIGINCYYPLSKKAKPSQKELDRGFVEVMDGVERVARASGKEVLLTEIGYRTVTQSWLEPYAEPNGRTPDNAAQAACYQAMIRGLKGRDWCKGVYLWKWPAYMDHARHDLQGFTPLGRPSQGLVEGWFRGE